MGVTHRPILIASPIPTSQHVTMDIRNYGVGVRKITMNLGDDGMRFPDVITNVGNSPASARLRRR